MWLSPIENAPEIVQTDFGAWGQYLPDDGADYCAPTACSMSFYYLYANGFTQVAPGYFAGQDRVVSINFERVIAGLLETAARGGTGAAGRDGISDFFSMRGIARDSIEIKRISHPTPNDFKDYLAYNVAENSDKIAFAVFSVGWFKHATGSTTELVGKGGHVLTPLVYDSDLCKLILNNPAPASFDDVPNQPSYGQQTVSIEKVPSDWTYDGKCDLPWWQAITPSHGPDKQSFAIINGLTVFLVPASAIPSEPYQPATWTLDQNTIIDTNGAATEALAPISGRHGFIKMGTGTFRLSNTVDTSGHNYVMEGTLESVCASDTPFGTGELHLTGQGPKTTFPLTCGGTLRLSTERASSVTIASGNRLNVRFGTGACIDLAGPENCTVLLGGNDEHGAEPSSSPNLIRIGRGTLELAVGDLARFGSSFVFQIRGSGSNLPALRDGFVPPYIVGTGRPVSAYGPWQGQFLTYASDGAGPALIGVAATRSTDVSINDLGSDSPQIVYAMTDDQTIESAATVTVAALSIASATLDCGHGTIAVGDRTSGGCGGLILSGAAIRNGTLAFGATEGLIWIGGDSDEIAADVTGSNGLTFFGPGRLTLSSAGSKVKGPVAINGGTLIVAGTLDDGAVLGLDVNEGATLVVSGAVGSDIRVSGTGTLSLGQGVVSGKVTTSPWSSSTSAIGSVLEGCGRFTDHPDTGFTVYGLIKAGSDLGYLTFERPVTIDGAVTFAWSLGSLVSDCSPDGNWNALKFKKPAQFGSEKQSVFITPDFSLLKSDPDQDDSGFWTEKRAWKLIDYDSDFDYHAPSIGNRQYETGQFTLEHDDQGKHVHLVWTPIS